ncbi:MAG: F-box protein [Alphaproteobacteria bacterium]
MPSEIIRLILDGLSKPDLKNLRLVDQKLRDVVTSFLTDIKIPRNIPSAEQAKTFFQDLATVKFWEGKKPSEAFINLFRNAPIKGLELGRKEISAGNLKDPAAGSSKCS